MDQPPQEKRRGRPERLFFPAALLLAAVIVPLKAAENVGWLALPPLPPFWHGHEMVFGVVYGVIGGYLLVGLSERAVALAFAAWIAGRLVLPFYDEMPLLATALALAYPAVLAVLVGSRFLKATKTRRNAVFAPIIFGLLLAQIAYETGGFGVLDDGGRLGLLLGADMTFLLLFAMGGRIIAGVSSGAHQAQGRKLVGVSQPRLEQAGLAALVGMLGLDGWHAAWPVSGGLAIIGTVILLLRLVKWQVWRLFRISEVSLLHLGYLWLAAGLLAKGWAQINGVLPVLAMLHIGLIGGFGTLALTMMMRANLQRDRRPVRLPRPMIAAVLLVSASVFARLAAIFAPASGVWLGLSALFWTIAVLAVLARLIRWDQPDRDGRSKIGA